MSNDEAIEGDALWPKELTTARLLNALNESVVVTDAAGQIVFWNSMAETMYGWSAAEVTGRNVLEVVTPVPNAGAQALKDTLVAGEMWSGPLEVQRRDGSTVHTIATNHPVLGDDGSLVAVIGVGLDATRERGTAASRDALFRRFQALIESSGDLFAVASADAVVQSLDGPVESFFGVGSEAFVGRNLFDLVRAEDLERAHNRWEEQLVTLAPIPSEDYWTQRPDGGWICLNLQTSHLVRELGVAGMAVTARDVTAKKNLERSRVAISSANSALVHASDEGGLFDEICRVVVDQTMYHLAWIGLADPTRSLGVRMVAFADHSAAYIEALELLAGQGYSGPLAQALKSHDLVVVQDVARVSEDLAWRELALHFGFRSLIALPLTFSETDTGVLAIYSEQPNVFTDDAISVLTELASDLAFGIGALRARAERSAYRGRFEASLAAAVRAIATAAELRDPYTAGHQNRVAHLAAAIATELGIDSHAVEGIRTAASIHDIGKLLVPAEILSKPGRLSVAEFDIIKQHPQAGYDIVAGIDFPWPVAQMILQHHERLDGSGYPNNLLGPDIIIGARILAVADTVEAMHAHRPYRPGLGIDVALGQIELDRSTRFDATVVDVCLQLFRDGGFKFGV